MTFLEFDELSPHLPVEFAGWQKGPLSAALFAANEAGRAWADELLSSCLPGVPSVDGDRSWVEVGTSTVGPGFATHLDASSVVGAISRMAATPEWISVHDTAVPVGVERFRQPARHTPSPPGLVLGRLARAVDSGSTLQLKGLDLAIPDLAVLAEAIERTTGARVSVNGFVSRAGDRGLGRHSDVPELWVVQLKGNKRWDLWRSSVAFANPRRPSASVEAGEHLGTFDLGPGDVLVVPRGTFHEVTATDGTSVAVTFAVDAPSRAELVETAMSTVGGSAHWLTPVHVAAPTAEPVAAEICRDLDDLLRQAAARTRATIPARNASASPSGIVEWLSGNRSSAGLRTPLGGGVHVVAESDGESPAVLAGGGMAVKVPAAAIAALPILLCGRPVAPDALTDGVADLAEGLASAGLAVPV